MARSDRSRTALLDAAERLFAEAGIAQTSDRKIAEAAGNSNHSAVGYYFGGREGLLRALLTRHITGLEPRRQEMSAASASLLDDVRGLVVPATDALGALAAQAGRGSRPGGPVSSAPPSTTPRRPRSCAAWATRPPPPPASSTRSSPASTTSRPTSSGDAPP
ncbi:TetR/AcrR family transcriptional regulator [Actinomadura keratinilytica]